ncbi:MAG: DUF222 domain-containing protein, partial [Actinomycetia bacterium]|nr:DUF222 domain-containing protein [Actinomycetes bacterium]
MELSGTLARCQHQLVKAAAEFAESAEWLLAGSPTAAGWLAGVADVEESTAREWIRTGRRLGELPVIAEGFGSRELSYSKVRTLTRVATRENEAELAALAKGVPASELATEIAAWMNRNLPPVDIAEYQRRQRMVKWRHSPDGMIVFTLRLEPHTAAALISLLTSLVMRSKARQEPDGTYPGTVAQYADEVEELLTDRAGQIDTEVIFHVRGDGATTDDGTPITDTVTPLPVRNGWSRNVTGSVSTVAGETFTNTTTTPTTPTPTSPSSMSYSSAAPPATTAAT